MLRILVALSVCALSLSAQRNVSPENLYHRVYAVVPMVGSGTPEDPKRPMLVPAPGQTGSMTGERPELLGFRMQMSDNGNFALVEFVFQSPVAFHNFLAQAVASGVAGTRAASLPAIAADGSDLKALDANVGALKDTLEKAVPGLRLFERGKAAEALIRAQFQALKADFDFDGSSVRPQ